MHREQKMCENDPLKQWLIEKMPKIFLPDILRKRKRSTTVIWGNLCNSKVFDFSEKNVVVVFSKIVKNAAAGLTKMKKVF